MATNYYKAQLERGQLYQDFVIDECFRRGLVIVQWTSKVYQLSEGESKSLHEIKFDDRFEQTGNLWIEIKEKSHPLDPDWIESGIYRPHCNELVIGNFDVFYRLPVRTLRQLHTLNPDGYPIIPNHLETSLGFLLSGNEAKRHAVDVYVINQRSETVRRLKERNRITRRIAAQHMRELFDQRADARRPRLAPDPRQPQIFGSFRSKGTLNG